MCYINGVRVSLAQFIEYKQQQKELAALKKMEFFKPVRRGFDYSEWPIIKPIYDGTNQNWELVMMEWGFIPSWLTIKMRQDVKNFRNGYTDAKGKYNIGYTTLNAVGEEIFEKGMYKEAAMKRRCLVISTEFYEHRHVEVVGKRGKVLKTPDKIPYHVNVRDQPYFFIPAIYNPWTDHETGETIDTFALLTTEAEGIMRQIHNSKDRMPVIFTRELAEEWTNEDLTKERVLELAKYKIDTRRLEAYTVPKDFLTSEDPDQPFKICNYVEAADLIYETD